jgi:hypothetical protein
MAPAEAGGAAKLVVPTLAGAAVAVVQLLSALGFQAYDLRVLVHSLLGCVFFGVFIVKMLVPGQEGPGTIPVQASLIAVPSTAMATGDKGVPAGPLATDPSANRNLLP